MAAESSPLRDMARTTWRFRRGSTGWPLKDLERIREEKGGESLGREGSGGTNGLRSLFDRAGPNHDEGRALTRENGETKSQV